MTMVLINHAVQKQCGRLHGLTYILGRNNEFGLAKQYALELSRKASQMNE